MDQEVRSYRRNGFLIRPWAKTPTLSRLNELCRDIFEGRIKESYKSVSNHDQLVTDLALDHNYDSVLLDILFENDVPRLLQSLIGVNATLYYINAITSFRPGYMTNWHCDGFVRPVHKLFFYPTFDGNTEPCLEVVSEHVKPAWMTYNRLWGNDRLLKLRTVFKKKQVISSSNDQFVVLHTETPHRAAPVTSPAGVFRLIYNFIDWFQDADERRHITSFPLLGTSTDAYSHINDKVVEYYQHRLANNYSGRN